MFENLHMFPEGALFFKNSPGISSLVCSVWFSFFRKSCNGLELIGPMVLFEGSPSRSVNLNDVVELCYFPPLSASPVMTISSLQIFLFMRLNFIEPGL